MKDFTSEQEAQLQQLRDAHRHTYMTDKDLPEDLRDCVNTHDGIGMQFFHHPFLVQMMPLMLPCTIEEAIDARSKNALAALERGDIHNYVFRHERGWRLEKTADLARDGLVPNTPRAAVDYWKLAAHVWTDGEAPEDDPSWLAMIEPADEYLMSYRPAMTSSKDRRALKRAGETLTVYRGVQAQDEDEAHSAVLAGTQWSRSQDTAVWFARRFLRDPDAAYLAEAEVPVEHIIAYLTSRGEEEVIVHPDDMMTYGDIGWVTEVSRKPLSGSAFAGDLKQALDGR